MVFAVHDGAKYLTW